MKCLEIRNYAYIERWYLLEMTKNKLTYQERAERLKKAIDIAEKIVSQSLEMEISLKKAMLSFGNTTKKDALNPLPEFKKIASIKCLENDFLIYWNETKGEDVERFWKEIYDNEIGFERKDTIKLVLKRNKIKNRNEYNNIIDTIVVAEQTGRITTVQKEILSKLISQFENR